MASKRSYPRFKRDEPVVVALPRLTTAQVLRAEHLVRSSAPQETIVHGVRLTFKFLRAMLRLSREAVGPAFAHHQNSRLRKAALSLSLWRDEKVVTDTLTTLGDKVPGISHSSVQDALHAWQHQARPKHLRHQPLPVTLREALKALKTFQKNLALAPLGEARWDAISEGLKQSYRKAQCSLRLAEAAGVDEPYHDARKRVKDLFYHVSLLGPALPKEGSKLEKRLSKLQALLGEDHDLSVAREVMLHAKSPEATALKALRKSSSRLRREISRRADKIFCPETKDSLKNARKCLQKWPLKTH